MTDEKQHLVRTHLNQVLASIPFQRSPRCREFLQYVVERTIEGRSDLLKERCIGLALFGRKADYETADDSIVRVRANEVRKRLTQFYLRSTATGVQFGLAVGSYVPQITIRETGLASDPIEPAPRAAPLSLPDRRIRVAAAGLAVIVLTLLVFWFARGRTTPLEEFWKPVTGSARPALLWSSAGEFQRLSPRILRQLSRTEDLPVQVVVQPQEVEYIESQISSGNLHSIVSIFSILQRLGHVPEYRLGGEITLQEMGSRPLILIGAFSNPWVMQLNSSWRFQFTQDRPAIRDTQTPGRDWMLPASEPPSGFDATVDYALVTRVFRQDTRQVLIVAGGLKHFGTEAAGEFVSNPIYWRDAVSHLPKNWARRNVQVVLETRVIRKAASPPKVLAVHCW